MNTLRKGSHGEEVKSLQRKLTQRGYPVVVDGDFGQVTYKAVRAYQSQNVDSNGRPLVVDGVVGPLTWWSLTNPKPDIVPPGNFDYLSIPSARAGGSKIGRAALQQAQGELRAGAGEIGGDNRGPFVKRYLAPAGLDEGNAWCAAFVSWCFLETCDGAQDKMPFRYDPSARSLLKQFEKKGWAILPQSDFLPGSGDLVFWWREKLTGWTGHVGLVHSLQNGYLYTIEGNKTKQVQGFSYVKSRMDKLLGFGRVNL